MIAFVDDYRAVHGVEPICRVLQIAPPTYRTHHAQRRDPSKTSARAQQDGELRPQIRRAYLARELSGFRSARSVRY